MSNKNNNKVLSDFKKNKMEPISPTGSSKKNNKNLSQLNLKRKKRQVRLKNLRDQAKIANIPKVFISTLSSILPKEISLEQLKEAINEVTYQHNKMIDNHSIIEGTARFACIRLYAIQLLEGQKVQSPIRVAVGIKDRWPSVFNKMRPFYYRVRDLHCVNSERIIRSILYINRLCTGNSVIDTTEIVKQFTVSEDFKSRYRSFLKEEYPDQNHGELISKPTLKVVSSGPNSKPKWETADLEAYALIHSEYEPHFYQLCLATGNLDFYNYVKHQASLLDRDGKVRLRYILSIPDKGNKSRLVAISDYWTQIILTPIMEDIKEWIEENFSDVESSREHSLGFNKLKKFIRPGIMSKDIKSWTDAHPHSMQHIFMEHRYGKAIADAWLGLVVSCEWNVKGLKSKVKYGRGQGMGTAGSFDIATACDISIIKMIYRDEYQLPIEESLFNKVGDDLWCYDPDDHLHRTFTEEMGMEISIPKSKEATKDNLCGEFVSRNLNYGKDVSRISANICRAVGKNLLDLPELMRHLSERTEENYPIKIRDIFSAANVKFNGQHIPYIRAFYALSLMHPDRTGMKLLRYSLINDFLDFIENDEFIKLVKTKQGIEAFKNSYYLYSGSCLLNSIVEKAEEIAGNTRQFQELKMVESFGDPSTWWLNLDENISMKTSKMALDQSRKAHLQIYDENMDPESAIAKLEHIEQSLTFKELGVISTSERPLRPMTSRVFKIVKTIVVQPPKELLEEGVEFHPYSKLLDLDKVISVSIDMENRVMLPSTTEKFLAVRDLPQLPNNY